MAIGTPVNRGTASGSTTATTASFTPDDGDILLAFAMGRRSTTLPVDPVVSDSLGGTWTEIAAVSLDTGSNPRMKARLLYQQITTGAAMTVTADVSDGTTTGLAVVSVSGAGTDFSNFATDTDLAGDPSTTLAALSSGSAVIGFTAQNATNLIAQDASFTELLEITANSTMKIEAAYDLSSPSTTVSWTSTNQYSIGIAVEIKEASTSIVGTLSKTLDAITVSSAGTIALAGALSQSIGSVTLSSAGAVALAGSLSAGIGGITLSSTIQLSGHGALDASIGDVTLSSAGALPISGALTASIGEISTSSAVGDVLISGALAASIGEVSLSALGSVSITGSASATIGDVTISAAGALALSGEMSQSIGDILLAADGSSVIEGSGALSASIGDISLSSAGALSIAGVLSSGMDAIELLATGALSIVGEVSGDIGDITISATGSSGEEEASGGGGAGRPRRKRSPAKIIRRLRTFEEFVSGKIGKEAVSENDIASIVKKADGAEIQIDRSALLKTGEDLSRELQDIASLAASIAASIEAGKREDVARSAAQRAAARAERRRLRDEEVMARDDEEAMLLLLIAA